MAKQFIFSTFHHEEVKYPQRPFKRLIIQRLIVSKTVVFNEINIKCFSLVFKSLQNVSTELFLTMNPCSPHRAFSFLALIYMVFITNLKCFTHAVPSLECSSPSPSPSRTYARFLVQLKSRAEVTPFAEPQLWLLTHTQASDLSLPVCAHLFLS